MGDSRGSRRYPCELSSETGRCSASRKARPGWSFPPFARQTVASGGRARRPIARPATQDAPPTRGTPPSQTASVCRTDASMLRMNSFTQGSLVQCHFACGSDDQPREVASTT